MSSPPLNNTQGQEGNLSLTYQPDSLHNSDNTQLQAIPQPYQSQPQRTFRAPRICCCELRTGLMAMALFEITVLLFLLIVIAINTRQSMSSVADMEFTYRDSGGTYIGAADALNRGPGQKNPSYHWLKPTCPHLEKDIANIILGFLIGDLLAAVALFFFTFQSIKIGCVGSHAIQWNLFVSEFVVRIILEPDMARLVVIVNVFSLLFKLYGCAIVYYFYKETTGYNANPPSNIYGGNTTGGYGNINNPPPYYERYVQPDVNNTTIQYGEPGYSQPYYNVPAQVPPPQH